MNDGAETGRGTPGIRWGRALLAGLAGGAAWIAALLALFGPAQAILSDPAYQSQKFIDVFANLEPLPRNIENPLIMPAGLLVIGVIYGLVFAVIRRGLPGASRLARGLSFGVVAWLLAFPWFEFYLPWNVMHEPAALVALELALWLGVMLVVGQAISWTYGQRRGPA
ncbi:MAG: hypothetical protein ACLFWF_06715 [Alphaproteobacteria bacterium]